MSYEKTNWQTGDLITAEKLNHAEQGIYDNSTSGEILTVHIDINEQELAVLDKTWQEIHDASYTLSIEEDEATQRKEIIGFVSLVNYDSNDGGYLVVVSMFSGGTVTFVSQTANDYPIEESEGGGGGDNPIS